MPDVVTRLVVRGDGSLAVLDQFENKMEAAGKATDRATGAVSNYEARMAKARAAMEAGNAISTQTVARRSAEQRAFDGLASSVDKSYGLRIRLEREAERAAVSAANATNMGYISQEQALSALVALERRHAAQMSQSAGANDNLAASYRSSAAAADEAAAASIRANAARMRGGGGANQAHTTNLLFQAQDIAMMTAMGQAPMMIAMQQGMQVGGIFHQIGSGKQIVQALGGAIVGLLNPLNLAAIAVIGLGAAGVQWFMSAQNSADEATDALEKHREMLGSILEGYDGAKEAADAALASALKLPQGVVASDLQASLREQEAAAASVQQRIENNRRALDETISALRQMQESGRSGGEDGFGMEVGIRQLEMMRALAIDTASTRAELDAAATAAREFYNTTDDPALKDMSDQVYQLAMQLLAVQGRADSAAAALRAIPRDIQVRISMSQVFSDAMSDINALYMDPRGQFDRARDELALRSQAAQDSAQSMSELTALASDYERVLSSINAAEAKANEKAGAKGAKDAQKPYDQWGGNVDQFRQRIASQQMEIDLMGQSSYEVERQKAAFDLLNQAKQAGIPITTEVTDQINLMSSEYAAATVELQRQAEAQRLVDEQLNFYRGTFVGFFADMKSGLKEGQSFWEALGNAGANALDKIADRALSMAANGLFDMIFGAVMGGISGGFGGNPFSLGAGGAGFLGGGAAAWGPSFAGGGDTGYGPRSGGLDGQGGFLAMLHPRETVIDHTRPRAANQNQGNDNWPVVQIVDQRGRNAPAIQQEKTTGANGEKQLRLIIRDEVQQARRRGAVGF